MSEPKSMDGVQAHYEIWLPVSDRGDQGIFANITFQHDLDPAKGRNGIFIEELIEQVILPKLRAHQAGPLASRETALAITEIENGLLWLNRRTELRKAQGVHATAQPHVS